VSILLSTLLSELSNNKPMIGHEAIKNDQRQVKFVSGQVFEGSEDEGTEGVNNT
jgi:hypothetical protein